MYALVDCNNFFVSCERAFQPELEGRPVVVLSNNDGCIVARSNESKAMGIQMGTPAFKIKGMVDSGRVIMRSSNYALYGDLSRRVMSILREAAPKIEVYSIDEAFMVMDGMELEEIKMISAELVRKIRKWVGIPVSIGIAPTKTLAKIASHFAKRYRGYRGVCVIDSEERLEKALSLTEIGDVWGIGRRSAPKLKENGIQTALDFVRRPSSWVDSHMGITGVRTWYELQGRPMVDEDDNQRRQSICTSRSFAEMISDYQELSLRVADFAGMCASKLRKEGSAAYMVSTFIQTNRFREDLKQYGASFPVRLEVPANSTQEIVGAALESLSLVFKEGFLYKRAGVWVDEIVDASNVQGSLFDEDGDLRAKENSLSAVMDRFNSSDKNIVRLAAQRPGHYADGIRREHCSRLYSTSWSDIITVK